MVYLSYTVEYSKGAWRENVFVERLFRTIKDRELKYKPAEASRRRIAVWTNIWNSTSAQIAFSSWRANADQVYFSQPKLIHAAA